MRGVAAAVLVSLIATGISVVPPAQAILPVEICGGIDVDEVLADIATASIDFIWFNANGVAPSVTTLGSVQLACTFGDYDLLFPEIPEINAPLACYAGEGPMSAADSDWNQQELTALNLPGCDDSGDLAPAEFDLEPFLGCLPDCTPPAPCNDVPTCADYVGLPCSSVPSCEDLVPPPPCNDVEECADMLDLPCNSVPTCLDLVPTPPCDDVPSCADYLGLPCNSIATCLDLVPTPPCNDVPSCADYLGLPCDAVDSCLEAVDCEGDACDIVDCAIEEVQGLLQRAAADCLPICPPEEECDDTAITTASRPSNFVVEVTVIWPPHDDPQYTDRACHREAMETALDALADRTGWSTKLNCGFAVVPANQWRPEPDFCQSQSGCIYATTDLLDQCSDWFDNKAGATVANDGQIGFCWAKVGTNNGAAFSPGQIAVAVDRADWVNHPDSGLALHEILHTLGADHFPDDTWRKYLCRQYHYHGGWKWHRHEYTSVMNYCKMYHGHMTIDQDAYAAII